MLPSLPPGSGSRDRATSRDGSRTASAPPPRSRRLAVAACALALSLGSLTTPAAWVADIFRELPDGAGLAFTHDNGARGEFHLPEIMGSGAALFDYDGDGDLDVFLVQGAASSTSRLFRNDLPKDARPGAVPRFTDVTERAGVGLRAAGMGAAVGDYDGDGALDLYVTAYGSNVLYRNNRDGTFADVTRASGADDSRWSTSAAFLDYDRDGDLDLFVANYVDFSAAARKACVDTLGAPDYCAPSAYRPVPDRLLRNEGDGTFTDATEPSGVSRAYGAGLGVAVGDYNGDGWLDVYVANDATPNQLWINRRNGTFEDEGWLSGAAVNAAGRPEGSMGIASGDYDGDGDEDLFVTNLARETFVLYANDGRASFEDRRTQSGVALPTAEMTGFGTAWIDYDRDGRLDLVIANGAVNTLERQRGSPRPFRQPNQLFRQEVAGRLSDVTAAAGKAFASADVGRGLATGDIDNDGDVDVLLTHNGGPARLLVNGASSGHWLSVRTALPGRNARGFGARVGVMRKGHPPLWRRIGTDGSYLSASDARAHFGLGDTAAIDHVIVEWPDGYRERWNTVAADREVVLERGSGEAAAAR